MDHEEQREAIREALEQCISMGLVEVVGITPDGDWLYGATEKGQKVVEMYDFGSTIESLLDMSEEDD